MKEKSYMTKKDRNLLAIGLRSDDYGWEKCDENPKKVVLTNPEALKNLTLNGCILTFRGTGHVEWEYLIGSWLIEAIGKALETGEECDITNLFNINLLATGNRRFTKTQLYNHLIPFFDTEETDELLKLTAKLPHKH